MPKLKHIKKTSLSFKSKGIVLLCMPNLNHIKTTSFSYKIKGYSLTLYAKIESYQQDLIFIPNQRLVSYFISHNRIISKRAHLYTKSKAIVLLFMPKFNHIKTTSFSYQIIGYSHTFYATIESYQKDFIFIQIKGYSLNFYAKIE